MVSMGTGPIVLNLSLCASLFFFLSFSLSLHALLYVLCHWRDECKGMTVSVIRPIPKATLHKAPSALGPQLLQ